ncbi:hypothetical protein [Microviridae sp.]|nr:hypothetical protein [Microviridae sp.]
MNGPHSEKLIYGVHAIRVSTTVPLLVSFNENPVATLAIGNHKNVYRGSGKLSFDPAGKGEYHVAVKTKPSQPGELLDHKSPPQPQAPENFLAQIREKVRQSLGPMREAFDDVPSIYETDSELFEEEEMALAEQEKKKQLQALKDAKEPDADEQKVPKTSDDTRASAPKDEKPADQANKNAQ